MLEAHIQLDKSVNAKYAIMPGDPARIDRIIPFLEDVKVLAYNREFRSISGYYKGVKVIAISTGIGGSSASIAIEELKHIGVDTMIRIGSCGALQKISNLEILSSPLAQYVMKVHPKHTQIFVIQQLRIQNSYSNVSKPQKKIIGTIIQESFTATKASTLIQTQKKKRNGQPWVFLVQIWKQPPYLQ